MAAIKEQPGVGVVQTLVPFGMVELSSFFFSSRRRHTRSKRDWSSDVCSSDLYSNAADSDALALAYLVAPCQVLGVVVGRLHYTVQHQSRRSFIYVLSGAAFGFARSEERRVGKEGR